jgi:hypothetical protein
MLFRKKPTQSALRYCQRATELPYGSLVRFRRFTVALARTSEVRRFNSAYGPPEPCAMGVLHGAATYSDGSEEPMLPVRITFRDAAKTDGQHMGSGFVDQHYGNKESFYVLELSIFDPGHTLYRDVDRAVERAALSQERFVHLDCRKGDWLEPKQPDSGLLESIEVENQILRAIEAGEASFPQVTFDEVMFSENLMLHAEPWAWAWPEFEAGGARFNSKGASKWRANRAKWFK